MIDHTKKEIACIAIAAAAFWLGCAASVFGQTDFPDKGTLADIKGKTKAYLIADAVNAKLVIKALGKSNAVTLVDKADNAEFFIEFKTIGDPQPVGTTGFAVRQGELTVYVIRDKRKVIAWSDGVSTAFKYPAADLTKKFLKAIEK